MEKKEKKAFDISLFKRLLKFVKPYKLVFFGTLIFAIGLALSGAFRPYVLQKAIDEHVALKNYNGFLFFIVLMAALLIIEVICQLLFIY